MEFLDSYLGQEVMATAALEGADCLPPASFFAETGESVWICGRQYPGESDEDRAKVRKVLRSFIWQTYRRGFQPIGEDNGPTSDRGWGCMLRCGQMVVAEALVRLRLGEDWTWEPTTADKTYLKILSMFVDDPSSPLSIHLLASTGAADGGKAVGQWYGPNTVAHVVRKLLDKLPSSLRLRAHVVMDNMLVIDDVDEPEETWEPLVVFVPLRLGLSEVNPVYVPGLKACFKAPSRICLGVIGGTPNHALYFVGCVGDELIYLDPHTTQATSNPGSKTSDEEVEADTTYHCNSPRRMAILQIDPSLAACFLCQTKRDFQDFCDWSKQHFVDVDNQPVFEVVATRPSFASASAACSAMDQDFEYESVRHLNDDGTESNDEFELIG